MILYRDNRFGLTCNLGSRQEKSIALNVDIMNSLMKKHGITPKFTAHDLKDISQMECGLRGQSRTYKLADDFQWTGETVNNKVPVIHLSVFPCELLQNELAMCDTLTIDGDNL